MAAVGADGGRGQHQHPNLFLVTTVAALGAAAAVLGLAMRRAASGSAETPAAAAR
ncbi:hypothetical protein [Amycolatopsis sp. NPDC098790]|uniref:hypothetical protein n=1 Tax=Amycolatopsis sp. NPDC098790 TaxID=3363939 RepID=UPI003829E179